VLGSGGSKWVWILNPRDKYAIINATNAQRGSSPQEKRKIRFIQKMEFEFTRVIQSVLPGIIPSVYEIAPNYTYEDGRYIYFKERTRDLVLWDGGTKAFYQMVDFVEQCLLGGLAYVDIKPQNLGTLMSNGAVVAIDTDPIYFYLLPDNDSLRRYYRTMILMTIVGSSYKNKTCPHHVLSEFIRDRLPLVDILRACDNYDMNHYIDAICNATLGLVAPCFEFARRNEHEVGLTALEYLKKELVLPFITCAYYTLGSRDVGKLDQVTANRLKDTFQTISELPTRNTPAAAAALAAGPVVRPPELAPAFGQAAAPAAGFSLAAALGAPAFGQAAAPGPVSLPAASPHGLFNPLHAAGNAIDNFGEGASMMSYAVAPPAPAFRPPAAAAPAFSLVAPPGTPAFGQAASTAPGGFRVPAPAFSLVAPPGTPAFGQAASTAPGGFRAAAPAFSLAAPPGTPAFGQAASGGPGGFRPPAPAFSLAAPPAPAFGQAAPGGPGGFSFGQAAPRRESAFDVTSVQELVAAGRLRPPPAPFADIYDGSAVRAAERAKAAAADERAKAAARAAATARDAKAAHEEVRRRQHEIQQAERFRKPDVRGLQPSGLDRQWGRAGIEAPAPSKAAIKAVDPRGWTPAEAALIKESRAAEDRAASARARMEADRIAATRAADARAAEALARMEADRIAATRAPAEGARIARASAAARAAAPADSSERSIVLNHTSHRKPIRTFKNPLAPRSRKNNNNNNNNNSIGSL
jgi:hypothetical protein